MSTLEAVLLGIVQGITEFLPVSSSGHLKLLQALFGFEHLDRYIPFDLACHLGTLFAIFFVFAREVKLLFTNKDRFFQVLLGTLPLFPLLFVLKPIKSLFNQPRYLGFCFILTSILLYAGCKLHEAAALHRLKQHKVKDPLFIGLFQAIAILPGVSRSGSTISAARLLGWSLNDAISFSFLLAIPAILGGVALETFQLFNGKNGPFLDTNLAASHYLIGFTSSFVMGFLSLSLLKVLAVKEKFMYFVWYCLCLGLATSIYFNFF